MSIYKEHGFSDRNDYLKELSDMYGTPEHVVHYLASILGENEDFDGLVTQLQDMAQGY